MKIRNLLLIGFLLLTPFAKAQFTSVTGTVTDLDGQTWNNGKWSVTIYNRYPQSPPNINGTPLTPSQLNQSGVMDGSGALAVILGDSSIIAPAGTYWVFTICPNASAQCSIVNTPVSGGSQNISSVLSSNLKGPRFTANSITGGAWGYLDAEISPTPNVGAQYFNVTNSCTKFWNGSAWACYNSGLAAGITNLTGDATANGPGSVPITFTSVNSGAGTCGDATHTCQATTNVKGLTTNQVAVPITFPSNNGITSLSGDITATGPGAVAATLPTVNGTPGTCGDSTHSCQNTTNAKGLVTGQTSVAIAFPSVPSKTCNGNGCYAVYPDGSIEAWGNSSTLGGAVSAGNLTITFPTTFSTTANLFIVTSATSSATGDGNPHPADCHIVRSSITTSGATSVIAAATQITGSGYANLAAGDYCSWHAVGF